ncbi:MAG: nuclear transport factor 2 family protein [Actinomycetota bacterium]
MSPAVGRADRMHDEAAVRDLLAAYCTRLDAGDFDGVAALFARGVFRSPAGTELVGPDAVRRMYEPVITYDDGTPRTKHVLGTVVVAVDAESGTATARSDFAVFQAAAGTPLQPVLVGRYHDSFTRADGAWWITERMVRPDLEGDLSRHMRRR